MTGRSLGLLAAAASLAAAACAREADLRSQTDSTLTIVDGNGAPVAGVEVIAQTPGGAPFATAVSSSAGVVTFRAPRGWHATVVGGVPGDLQILTLYDLKVGFTGTIRIDLPSGPGGGLVPVSWAKVTEADQYHVSAGCSDQVFTATTAGTLSVGTACLDGSSNVDLLLWAYGTSGAASPVGLTPLRVGAILNASVAGQFSLPGAGWHPPDGFQNVDITGLPSSASSVVISSRLADGARSWPLAAVGAAVPVTELTIVGPQTPTAFGSTLVRDIRVLTAEEDFRGIIERVDSLAPAFAIDLDDLSGADIEFDTIDDDAGRPSANLTPSAMPLVDGIFYEYRWPGTTWLIVSNAPGFVRPPLLGTAQPTTAPDTVRGIAIEASWIPDPYTFIQGAWHEPPPLAPGTLEYTSDAAAP